jgi:hypothetical protein
MRCVKSQRRAFKKYSTLYNPFQCFFLLLNILSSGTIVQTALLIFKKHSQLLLSLIGSLGKGPTASDRWYKYITGSCNKHEREWKGLRAWMYLQTPIIPKSYKHNSELMPHLITCLQIIKSPRTEWTTLQIWFWAKRGRHSGMRLLLTAICNIYSSPDIYFTFPNNSSPWSSMNGKQTHFCRVQK